MNIYVKVIQEYDGCFEVGNFYLLAQDEGDSVALYDNNGQIYYIPKRCIEKQKHR